MACKAGGKPPYLASAIMFDTREAPAFCASALPEIVSLFRIIQPDMNTGVKPSDLY
jgi:hypothetical protein